jgi:hypothetical protein
MNRFLIQSYKRLLTDVMHKSGVHLDVPDDDITDWLLNEAPLLDKKLLQCADTGIFDPSNKHEFGHLAPLYEWICVHHVLSRFGCANLDDPSLIEFRKEFCKEFGLLHQCLVFCYKAELEPTNLQILAAEQAFVDAEEGVGAFDSYFDSKMKNSPLFREARALVGKVIYRLNWFDIRPSHGPGSVYPPRRPCNKSKFAVIYDSIEEFYPFADYFCALPNFWDESIVARQDELVERASIVARLDCVPKDSRGPRLICVHPCEAVWIQQGHRRILEAAIERHPTTHGRIHFTDQSVNGALALSSSLSGSFATIDLKEASDRVSWKLVEYLFGSSSRYLNSCRATSVDTLTRGNIALQKAFPMGNASTFPVESLVFWAIVRAGIRCRHGLYCDDIYVFGDDIIVPTKYYEVAVQSLVRAGLVPNATKCFARGLFRESCGVEAIFGTDITPLRCKVGDIVTVSDALSLCDLAKRSRINGFEHLASYLYSRVRRNLKGIIGRRSSELQLSNNPQGQGIYEYVDYDFDKLLSYGKVRFNRALHRYETETYLLSAVSERLHTHAWWHVQDSLCRLCSLGGESYSETKHEYPVPYRDRLKRGWIPALLSR